MDKPTWRALLRRARRGDAEAQLEVGCHYRDGYRDEAGAVVVRRAPRKAVEWLLRSAEQGNCCAQNQLGVALSSGGEVPIDIEQAILWTKRALAQGDASAAHNLGTIHRDLGRHSTALRWYRRAVEMGEPDSLIEVGIALYFGIGARSDPAEACRCFRRVLEASAPGEVTALDHENAWYWLGLAHLEGRGVRKSAARARELLERADRDGDHEAAQGLLRVLGRRSSSAGCR